MAQSDWIAITSSQNNYFNSVSGTAVQHSTLVNPITSSGTWCRQFINANNTNTPMAGALIPINNPLLTSSVGYPYGYTYSLRCWIRLDNTDTDENNRSRIAMVFKGDSSLSLQNYVNATPTTLSDAIGQIKGYYLMFQESNGLGTEDSTLMFLRCSSGASSAAFTGADSLDPINNNIAFDRNLWYDSNAQNVRRWKRMRMDVMSLPNSDRITIFSGSQIPNDWTQLTTVEIPRTKIAAYVPWHNNPTYPSDNVGAATAGCMGIIYQSNKNVCPGYIDGFEVYREAITI